MATTTYVDNVGPVILSSWLNDVNDFAYHTTNTYTATAYTASLVDFNRRLLFTNAGAVTYTIPPNATVNFPLGTTIIVTQFGTGQVTISPGAGVTVGNVNNYTKTKGQYANITLMQVTLNTWIFTGDGA